MIRFAAVLAVASLAILGRACPASAQGIQRAFYAVEISGFSFLGFPSPFPAGRQTFLNFSSHGGDHALAVEAADGSFSFRPGAPQPGPAALFLRDRQVATYVIPPLAPGAYLFYCPIADHRAHGLELRVDVVAGAPASTMPPVAAPLDAAARRPVAPQGALALAASLRDYVIEGIPIQLPAGRDLYITASSDGFPHSLAIDGNDVEYQPATFDPPTGGLFLQAGQAGTFYFPALAPGVYSLYCPIVDHRARGMDFTLTVLAGSGTITTLPAAGDSSDAEPTGDPCRAPNSGNRSHGRCHAVGMATTQKTRAAWVEEALAEGEARRPKTEEDTRRLRAETKRLRALRDRLPSIAPDTTEQYIWETRDELDARP